MTIFDLPTLDPSEALRLAQATIATHPTLARFYDDEFIASLIRRRGAFDNVLLLRLVQPGNEINVAYWNEVIENLETLEAEGSFEAFHAKLRKHDGPSLESMRTELFLAAWLKRRGIALMLEPSVGRRTCEFMTLTQPETWWEIKTPLDLPELRKEAAVQAEVQRRFRRIDQPYVLALEKAELTVTRVPAAAKAIKRLLYAFHRDAGQLPHKFEADGLVIRAVTTTQRAKGYLGTIIGKTQIFQNENSAHILRRVIAAADQIPHEGGGIVVIDQSAADWIHPEDVVDACFGEAQICVRDSHLIDVRLPGAFGDPAIARVSAVVSYTRRWRDDDGMTLTVLHNPTARVALPDEFLRHDDVRHVRRVTHGRAFRLETTPDYQT